jgi:hypothetical protein
MRKVIIATVLCCCSIAAHAQSTCADGQVGVAPVATIAFVPPTVNSDGSALALPLTYNVYQSTVSGLEVKVGSGQKGSPISVATGLTPRTTYYFRISVTDAAGNEGALSNEVCKVFPGSVPGTVTITIS